MAADYPDWSKPRTLDALPNSLLYLDGEEAVTVGNTEGNRNGTAVPAGYRRVLTNIAARDNDGSRPFNFFIISGSNQRHIFSGDTTGGEKGVSWQGYVVLAAGEFLRVRHYIGTGADRVSWGAFGWDVPV